MGQMSFSSTCREESWATVYSHVQSIQLCAGQFIKTATAHAVWANNCTCTEASEQPAPLHRTPWLGGSTVFGFNALCHYLVLFCFFVFLAALGFSCSIQDLVPWQGPNQGPCIGSMEPYPLRHKGIALYVTILKFLTLFFQFVFCKRSPVG